MRNDALAQFNLAVMLVEGHGTAARRDEGIAWWRQAATNGLARAQDALAQLHERGEHVPKSMSEATAWYRKAAEQGWRDAQVSLATQYFLGRGAARDDHEMPAPATSSPACTSTAAAWRRTSNAP